MTLWRLKLRVESRSENFSKIDKILSICEHRKDHSSQFHEGIPDLDLLKKGILWQSSISSRKNVELIYKPLLLLSLCLYFCPNLQIFQRLQPHDLQLKRYGWWELLINLCSGGRGGSRGRVQGVGTPSPPFEMTCGFLIQLVFCKKKKTTWFIGVEVEQETSAPPPKKNSGSAPGWINTVA